MPVTIVVGGQFGSEGKGKVAHFFAREKRAAAAIRVGGPNSGHSVVDESGKLRVFRMLPTAAILPDAICVLAAGTYLDVEVLQREIQDSRLPSDRLFIDPNAYIVTDDHKRQESQWQIGARIGSTQSGTGAAVIDRIRRIGPGFLARNDARLGPYIKPVRPFLRSLLSRGEHVVLEGTQGFGLSLLHSDHFPHVTSRDTTAAGFLAEVGLSPFDVSDVVLVIRTFPIRVGGNSGPLPLETDWQTVSQKRGESSPLIEFTTVTRKVRRVAEFDPEVVKAAIDANQPSTIVLNHVDYFQPDTRVPEMSPASAARVASIENCLGCAVDWIGLGPNVLLPRVVKGQLRTA